MLIRYACYSYSVFVLFSKGMVDYQHVLAVHADATRKRKRNLADVEPESGQLLLDIDFFSRIGVALPCLTFFFVLFIEKGDPVDVDQDDLMILVPPLFSLKDLPQKIM